MYLVGPRADQEEGSLQSASCSLGMGTSGACSDESVITGRMYCLHLLHCASLLALFSTTGSAIQSFTLIPSLILHSSVHLM